MKQYMDNYPEEKIKEQLVQVNSKLSAIKPHIAHSWKLFNVHVSTVSRAALLEVAANLKNWLSTSRPREEVLKAKSMEVDIIFLRFLVYYHC
jgi:hypothetical protein